MIEICFTYLMNLFIISYRKILLNFRESLIFLSSLNEESITFPILESESKSSYNLYIYSNKISDFIIYLYQICM